jgi:acyl carrier protein
MDKILIKYINEHFSDDLSEESIGLQDDLLSEGLLDSFGMMKLIRFIEEKFETKVQPKDMTIENFTSIETIMDYLSRKNQ